MATELLTIRDVEQEYNVPASTQYSWRYSRQGPPSFRLGRRIYYRRQDLERHFEKLLAAEGRIPSE